MQVKDAMERLWGDGPPGLLLDAQARQALWVYVQGDFSSKVQDAVSDAYVDYYSDEACDMCTSYVHTYCMRAGSTVRLCLHAHCFSLFLLHSLSSLARLSSVGRVD